MLTEAQIKRIKKSFRMMNQREDRRDPLEEKAALHSRMMELKKGGKVAIVIWQMDCDCASWWSKMIIPANMGAFGQAMDSIYGGAEGPVRWHLDSPDVVVERNGRDHALEAHEDGHPHSVSY